MSKCRTCRYYVRDDGWRNAKFGNCRRWPPTIRVNTEMAFFPSVKEDTWCGEYEEKEKEDGSQE